MKTLCTDEKVNVNNIEYIILDGDENTIEFKE